MQVERLAGNPMIVPAMLLPGDGGNICGPCLLDARGLPGALGDYYLYFTTHETGSDSYIRMAYADSLEGPWTIYNPGAGVLTLADFLTATGYTEGGTSYVGWPQVERRGATVVMYFSARTVETDNQTFVATGSDGLAFTPQIEALGNPVGLDNPGFGRVFQYAGDYYWVQNSGYIRKSSDPDGYTDFALPADKQVFVANCLDPIEAEDVTTDIRRADALVYGSTLYVFFTRIGDAPERVLVSTCDLSVGDFNSWQLSAPEEVTRPLFAYEGSEIAAAPSNGGVQHAAANQLRDPKVFILGTDIYLSFSGAGEDCIVIGYLVAAEFGSMSITHGTTTRTAIADLVVDRLDAGAAAGEIIIRDGSTVLATVTLDDPAFGAAASGVATLLGVPLAATATGDGDADNFLAADSDGNTVFAGSVTATGGGGDLTLDTVTIATDDTVTITGGTYTAPV